MGFSEEHLELIKLGKDIRRPVKKDENREKKGIRTGEKCANSIIQNGEERIKQTWKMRKEETPIIVTLSWIMLFWGEMTNYITPSKEIWTLWQNDDRKRKMKPFVFFVGKREE